MQVFFLIEPPASIHRNASITILRNVKLKHKIGGLWLWKQPQACLSAVFNGALITITCLYTAGSSIREFPVSPCQHTNLHRCVYHRTCMLTPTYFTSYSSLRLCYMSGGQTFIFWDIYHFRGYLLFWTFSTYSYTNLSTYPICYYSNYHCFLFSSCTHYYFQV